MQPRRRQSEPEAERDRVADGYHVAVDGEVDELDGGLRVRAHQAERTAVAPLDERTKTVAGDPSAMVTAGDPPLGQFEGDGGMVLADVVEVVGDGAAHVGRRVLDQRFEQSDVRRRVGDEVAQQRCPREPGARPL